jgi:diguanylate cyclase (GGDEF)-like protein
MTGKHQPRERTHKKVGRVLGIRGRLIVLAIIAIVPLGLDRVHDLEAERAERIEAAAKQARELAQRGADKQNELLATTRAFLQVVARSYATFRGSTEACGRFLANLATGVPWARGISVAAPDGRIACSSNPSAVGLDISDRPHFQQPLLTGEFFVSEYTYGRRIPLPSLFASFPQRAADGSVEAIAVIVIDLNWISQGASVIAERSGSVVLIEDGAGTIVAHQPDPDKWVGRRFSDAPLVRTMLAHSEGTATEEGPDGVRRIFGFVRLPGTKTHLAVGLDESEVLRRVNHAMWASYAQLILITGIVMVGIWFGGERLFVQPIHVLARTAKRFGQGELETRATGTPWAAEFVPLATALDDMAGALSAREHEWRTTHSRLEALAQIDGLTGLANRRAFDARLESEWQHGRPIALLMIDLDYFKRLNDHAGHVAGDACLRSVARVFAAAVRQGSDMAARYGGEEFALLLSGADINVATRVATRVRAAVEDLRIPHAAAPAGHVTISIGIAALGSHPGVEPQVLVETADAGLYEAKRRGRNTIAIHSAETLAATG